jgi:carbon monoxide dehydrogenase subunit G
MRRTLPPAFDLQRGMRFSFGPIQDFTYPMNVSGEFTVNAPRDVVYKTLRDASSFVRFVDGVHDLKEIDPTHYEAVFETKVAYLKFKFAVTVEVTRADEPSEIEAKIEGIPLGVVGRLTARSITRLEDAGNETKVTYSVESTLAGKLGSIGQPVLRSKAKDMEKQFAARLRAAFAEAKPEAQ